MKLFFTDSTEGLSALQKTLRSIPTQKILLGVAVLAVSLLAVHLLLRLTDRLLLKTKLDKSLHRFIKSILRALLYFLVILLVCGTVGIDVTSLVAVLSVVSLAVSLAVQDVLSNVAGGTMVMAAKPFKQGDYVQIDATEGTIDEISTIYTKMTTVDNRVVFLPNCKVATAVIQNYTVSGKRRIDAVFTASYDCEPDEVRKALSEAVRFPAVLPDKPVIEIKEYGASDISYQVYIWVKPSDVIAARFTLNERVWEAFKAHGIVMTYPHMNVHVQQL